MAIFRHISTKLVLVLDAGTEDGKKRKRVTVSGIRRDASADALRELTSALGKVLAHPVAQVLLYTEEAVEREDEDSDVPGTGSVPKGADAGDARAAYRGVLANAALWLLSGGNKKTNRQYFAPSSISPGNGSIRPLSTLTIAARRLFGRRGNPGFNQAACCMSLAPERHCGVECASKRRF